VKRCLGHHLVLTGAGAGHELGHSNNLITVAGALAGAYAGHKLEVKHEKDKQKKERREGEVYDEDDYGSRRSRSISRSRRRSASRRRSESSSSDESDSSRRRRRHHRD
jgi:uncharacterized protein YcfJ